MKWIIGDPRDHFAPCYGSDGESMGDSGYGGSTGAPTGDQSGRGGGGAGGATSGMTGGTTSFGTGFGDFGGSVGGPVGGSSGGTSGFSAPSFGGGDAGTSFSQSPSWGGSTPSTGGGGWNDPWGGDDGGSVSSGQGSIGGPATGSGGGSPALSAPAPQGFTGGLMTNASAMRSGGFAPGPEAGMIAGSRAAPMQSGAFQTTPTGSQAAPTATGFNPDLPAWDAPRSYDTTPGTRGTASDLMFDGTPMQGWSNTMTPASAPANALSPDRAMETNPDWQGAPAIDGLSPRGVDTREARGINIGDRELDALARMQAAENPHHSARGAEAWAALNREAAPTDWWGRGVEGVLNAPFQFTPVLDAPGRSVWGLPRSPETERDLRGALTAPNPVPGMTHFANPNALQGRATPGTQAWVNAADRDPNNPRVGAHVFANVDRTNVPQYTPVVTAGLDQFQRDATPGAQFANLNPVPSSAQATQVASRSNVDIDRYVADVPTPPSRAADLPGYDAAYASMMAPEPLGTQTGLMSSASPTALEYAALNQGFVAPGRDPNEPAFNVPAAPAASDAPIAEALGALNQPSPQESFSIPGSAGTGLQGPVGTLPGGGVSLADALDPESVGAQTGIVPGVNPAGRRSNEVAARDMDAIQSLQAPVEQAGQFNAFETQPSRDPQGWEPGSTQPADPPDPTEFVGQFSDLAAAREAVRDTYPGTERVSDEALDRAIAPHLAPAVSDAPARDFDRMSGFGAPQPGQVFDIPAAPTGRDTPLSPPQVADVPPGMLSPDMTPQRQSAAPSAPAPAPTPPARPTLTPTPDGGMVVDLDAAEETENWSPQVNPETGQLVEQAPAVRSGLNIAGGVIGGQLGAGIGAGLGGPIGAVAGGLLGSWAGGQMGNFSPGTPTQVDDQGGGESEPIRRWPQQTASAPSPTPVQRVADRYLLPMFDKADPERRRPTPYERFIANRSNYGRSLEG